jgi:hypothetical protein
VEQAEMQISGDKSGILPNDISNITVAQKCTLERIKGKRGSNK